MGRARCDKEEAVLRAVRTGEHDPQVEEHLTGCATCQETLLVGDWMRDFASQTLRSAHVADAGAIWWRAQLVRRWTAEQKAAAPIDAIERVELPVAVLAALAFFAWHWSTIAAWFGRPDAERLVAWVSARDLNAWLPLLGVSLVLVAITAFVTIRGLVSQE